MSKTYLIELITKNEYDDDAEKSYFLVEHSNIKYYTEDNCVTDKIFKIIDILGYYDEEEENYTYIKANKLEKALQIYCKLSQETLLNFKILE